MVDAKKFLATNWLRFQAGSVLFFMQYVGYWKSECAHLGGVGLRLLDADNKPFYYLQYCFAMAVKSLLFKPYVHAAVCVISVSRLSRLPCFLCQGRIPCRYIHSIDIHNTHCGIPKEPFVVDILDSPSAGIPKSPTVVLLFYHRRWLFLLSV